MEVKDLQKLLENPKADDQWSDYVPIIKKKGSKTTHAYITDGIDVPSEYNKLCHVLNGASSDEEVMLHLNTPGGMIDSAFMLIDAIGNSKATITAKLSGTVASAGTIIALSCDKLEVAPHTAFMVHNYSSGISGKGHEMKAYQSFVDENLNTAFKTMYSDFLNKDEMEEVIDGKDLWLNSKEVAKRWKKVLAARKQ